MYTHMKSHEDTRINDNQGKATKIDMLSTELSMATSYMVPEIISMDEAKLNEYLQDEKLSFYKKYVDEILRVKPHTLSERRNFSSSIRFNCYTRKRIRYDVLCRYAIPRN